MPKKKRDLTGMRFGKLVVTKEAPSYRRGSDNHLVTCWYCDCDCGTKDKIFTANHLICGNSKSCGCWKGNYVKEARRKYNTYDLVSYDYGVGWTSNTNEEFYFDLEDYDKIKNYCWRKGKKYIIADSKNQSSKTKIFLHKLVMNDINNNYVIDHINSLNCNDNRKCNLRIVTRSQNSTNRKRPSNNKSGVTGVHWSSVRNRWIAELMIHNKRYVYAFHSFEEAVAKRKELENEFHKEYSFDNSQLMSSQNKLKEKENNG